MPSLASQHIVQTRKESVEARQLCIVQRIAPRKLGQKGDVIVIIPHSMRNQVVDAFCVLLDCNLVERLDRYVAHCAIRLGHDESLVPVVGRRRDYFVEVLGRAPTTYLVDTRHRQVFSNEHQVARYAGWVHNLLLVLMSGGQDAVFCCPVADGLHESLAIKRGVQAEKEVPRVCSLFSNVVP